MIMHKNYNKEIPKCFQKLHDDFLVEMIFKTKGIKGNKLEGFLVLNIFHGNFSEMIRNGLLQISLYEKL